jgi:hypothetical protein
LTRGHVSLHVGSQRFGMARRGVSLHVGRHRLGMARGRVSLHVGNRWIVCKADGDVRRVAGQHQLARVKRLVMTVALCRLRDYAA